LHLSIHSSARTCTAALCLALLAAAPAHADTPGVKISDAAYAATNTALVSGHVLPAYRTLETGMAALDTTTAAYCTGDDTKNLANVKTAFVTANDAWMGAEHIAFGPVDLFMRNLRLNFWPQARGKISDAVADAIVEQTDDNLKEVGKGTFALQGLPAFEYLLYSDDGLTPASPQCALASGIAANMHTIATDIVHEWTAGDPPFTTRMAEPGGDNFYFATHADVTLALFKSLHEGLQKVATLKLVPVLGTNMPDARPALAESSLSNRALENIRINLAALQQLYRGTDDDGLTALARNSELDPKLDALMRKAFTQTIATANAITLPLPDAVMDAQQRKLVEKLTTQTRALRQITAERLAPALGLSVGFNSLDGD